MGRKCEIELGIHSLPKENRIINVGVDSLVNLSSL